MKRLECVLGAGPAAIPRARACTFELLNPLQISWDERNAVAVAVQQVTERVLRASGQPPSRLRFVGVCSRRKVRILVAWSGNGSGEASASLEMPDDLCFRDPVLHRLVDHCRELSSGSRRGVVLEKNLGETGDFPPNAV
jgi:hypothetical protein